MEAYFDNNANILNACIRIKRDDSIAYSIKTTFGLRGRKLTILKDENPGIGVPAVVGLINWNDRIFDILGKKKKVSEVRRREGKWLKQRRYWRWTPEEKEYELVYDQDTWKATLDNNISIAARFAVPPRPHLFSKPPPSMLHLTKTALQHDEVFLILAFIYSEVGRQDKTVWD